MSTYQLDPNTWDLVIDQFGNFAQIDGPAAQAQDVASEVQTYLGECWYDITRGMPYFQSIWGQRPSGSFLRANIERCALRIDGITGCTVVSLKVEKRVLTGNIVVTNITGKTIPVNFNVGAPSA